MTFKSQLDWMQSGRRNKKLHLKCIVFIINKNYKLLIVNFRKVWENNFSKINLQFFYYSHYLGSIGNNYRATDNKSFL